MENNKWVKRGIFGSIGFIVFIILLVFFLETVPAGHVGVGSVFGKVQSDSYDEGLHVVNPFMKMSLFDARQKTHKESMGVPSQDQLTTDFQLSIQYRLIKSKAPEMLKETGTPEEVLAVHMIPLLRSQMREIGKSVATAENFFDQPVQQRIQTELLAALSALNSKGVQIDQLLIRDIQLPQIITDAVMRKKTAAQAAEKAKEDLKKFKVDQERKETQALAEKRAQIIDAEKQRDVMLIKANGELAAARIDAKAVIVRAEAEARAKRKVINVVTLKGYVKLESMKSLEKLQKGNHMIIMDAKSINPLPFLNLGK